MINSGSVKKKISLDIKDIRSEEKQPLLRKTKQGTEVGCPFCTPPHPIIPGVESPCGTTLKVMAVRNILKSHATRFHKIQCVKCHQTGGEMVRYQNGFVHIQDCMPGTKLLTEPPKFSKFAAYIFHMKEGKLRTWFEKKYGKAQECREIDPDGKDTGKVLGHFFWKG